MSLPMVVYSDKLAVRRHCCIIGLTTIVFKTMFWQGLNNMRCQYLLNYSVSSFLESNDNVERLSEVNQVIT